MTPRRWMLIPAAALLALPLGLISWTGPGAAAQSGRREAASTLSGSGTLAAHRIHELRVPVKRHDGEIVLSSLLPPGTRVSSGDSVASFDLGDIASAAEAAVNEMEVALRGVQVAEAELNRHLNDGAEREARLVFDLQGAAGELQYWQKYGQADELKRAELAMQGHIDGIADQEDELNQLEELYKGNRLATESQRIVLERARRRLQRARDSYEIAKHNNEWQVERAIPRTAWEREANHRRLQARYERFESEEIAAAAKLEIALMRAESALKAAEKRLSELNADQFDGSDLFAPASGIVLHGPIKDNNGATVAFQDGDRVAKNQVIATLLETDMLQLTVPVPVADLARLRASKNLSVRCEIADVTAPAVLDSVGGIVINDHVYVRVIVANDDHNLMHGMNASLLIGD